MDSKKIAVVIDVQYGFIKGGNLAVSASQDADKKFTQDIDTFLKNGKFTTVYFSKDMHHPINASIGSKNGIAELEGRPAPFKHTLGYYTGKNTTPNAYGDQFPTPTKLERKWIHGEDLNNQMIWPIHCILPKTDPWHPILVGKKANGSEYPATLYNSTTADGKVGKNGSDLAWALEKYDGDTEAPFDYYTVYKGFGKKIDSYSAVADAHGYTTPFIAKHKGEFLTDQSPVTYFIDKLREEVEAGVTDIYVMGIATNYCVEQTAKDILDLVVAPAKAAGKTVKVHFVHNLTLPVPGGNPDPTKSAITERVFKTLAPVLSPLPAYFKMEDAPLAAPMAGGRRCRCMRRHKGHCKQTRRSRCNCGKTRKHRKQRSCK